MAAYLYNFGKFVQWPAEAFPNANSDLDLCLYGNDTLGSAADALNGKNAHGHRIRTNRIRRGGNLEQCHIVFVSTSEQLYVQPLLDLTREIPILTVSEIEDFAEAGGIVGLTFHSNRLKFIVNTGAATRAGLHLSSQLLKLAIDIIEERSP
ncbi:MAG: YfiR family protein [Chromatiales bacterium]|nr:YfiR family protein [Chromatiales bacterium]